MSTTRNDVFREGLIAGVLGYAAVALVFVVLNLSQGLSAFFTPDALGRALLGNGGLDPVSPWAGVFAFNALHLAVSIAIGLLAAFIAHWAERDRDLATGLAFVMLVLGGDRARGLGRRHGGIPPRPALVGGAGRCLRRSRRGAGLPRLDAP